MMFKPTTLLEREIARQRAQILRADDQTRRALIRAHRKVLQRLRSELDALTAQIEAARAEGPVTETWLRRQDRFRSLIADMERETATFLRVAAEEIQGAKGEAVARALDHAPKLTVASLGPAPRNARAAIAGSFDRTATPAMREMVSRAADGRPLGQLLGRIAPQAAGRVRDSLIFGTASGRGVRHIAAEVSHLAGMPLRRAEVIARQEVIGAYRAASHEAYERSGVVEGWVWHTALDDRTCSLCWEMHGSFHSMSESLSSHVNCRCAEVPRTKSWNELGFDGVPDGRQTIESGADIFDGLPEADKLAILGRSRLEAYNAGQITLSDLVRETNHPRWGKGLRQATLSELGV